MIKIAVAIVFALIGAALMISVDGGEIISLKFALYAVFFGAIYFATLLSPAKRCWPLFRRQPKS